MLAIGGIRAAVLPVEHAYFLNRLGFKRCRLKTGRDDLHFFNFSRRNLATDFIMSEPARSHTKRTEKREVSPQLYRPEAA